jgi:hypothetical protein
MAILMSSITKQNKGSWGMDKHRNRANELVQMLVRFVHKSSEGV